MGIFSLQKQNDSNHRQGPNRSGILVFARSAIPSSQHGDRTMEPEISWSLAVADTKNNHQQSQHDYSTKHRMSFFNMRRLSPKDSTTSDQVKVHMRSASIESVDEFSLRDGALHVTHGTQIESRSEHGQRPSLLVKFQLKHASSVLSSDQTLSTRIEQILQSMTSVNSHLSNKESETWIRYALISLQHANILPDGNAFNVDNFIHFVQNKIIEIEAEALSASNGDLDGPEFVKRIDYQRHLEENARLKALLGHGPPENNEHEETSRQSSLAYGKPGIRGGFGGGFWITRPQGSTRIRDDSDPYGGLM